MLSNEGKVLFVTNDFGPRAGGIETFIIGLIERRAFASTIVYTSAQANSQEYDQIWEKKYGVKVIRDSSRILLPTPRVARRISALIKAEGISVAAFGAAAPLGLLAHSMKRSGIVRIVALTHGHEVWWAKVFPFNLLLRGIGTGVDSLTYLGEYTRQMISRPLTQSAKSAMIKIAPGIDTDHFSPRNSANLRQSLQLSQKKVIVCVARLVHRKGQDKLIDAMPSILESISNAHLLIVGQGPYQSKLVKRVKKLGLEESVTFVGRINYEKLPEYICVGDLFAMPSRSRFGGLEVEGLGIAYLEASACGLPVIAGSSGGAPDAVVDGKSGVVVNGTDITAIAKTVIKFLRDPEGSRQMGQFGRNWVVEKWRWEIWSQAFERLLKQ
ncbi:MAG: glycosyltransferase family 4 protein [Streptomycetaceae bacterium]|nr:glycosyltransferase family 4 protein [Streptomycetaceae bacterium]